MNINAWGEDVGLTGLLSIGIQVVGLFCLMAYLMTAWVVGALLKKLTGRENAITRWMAEEADTHRDLKCPYCHWSVPSRAMDWHIQEKHPISYRKIVRHGTNQITNRS